MIGPSSERWETLDNGVKALYINGKLARYQYPDGERIVFDLNTGLATDHYIPEPKSSVTPPPLQAPAPALPPKPGEAGYERPWGVGTMTTNGDGSYTYTEPNGATTELKKLPTEPGTIPPVGASKGSRDQNGNIINGQVVAQDGSVQIISEGKVVGTSTTKYGKPVWDTLGVDPDQIRFTPVPGGLNSVGPNSTVPPTDPSISGTSDKTNMDAGGEEAGIFGGKMGGKIGGGFTATQPGTSTPTWEPPATGGKHINSPLDSVTQGGVIGNHPIPTGGGVTGLHPIPTGGGVVYSGISNFRSKDIPTPVPGADDIDQEAARIARQQLEAIPASPKVLAEQQPLYGALPSANITYTAAPVAAGTGEYTGDLVDANTGAPVMSLTGTGTIAVDHYGVDIGTTNVGNGDNVITQAEGAKEGTVTIISGGYAPDSNGDIVAAPVVSTWADMNAQGAVKFGDDTYNFATNI